MDKNNSNKGHLLSKGKRKILKSGTIYLVVILFVCAIAGITMVLTRKTNNNVKTDTSVSKVMKVNNTVQNNSNVNNKVSKAKQNDKATMDNANLVKKNTDTSKDSVSANAKVVQNTMVSPVNGTIILGYTGADGSMAVGLDKVSRTILGEYIKVSSKGIPVYAVTNGTVLSIDGGRVAILSNDSKLKIIYDNLDPTSVTLKKGSAVTQNSKIGVIGDSDNAKDRIVDCDHLYFEIDEKQADGSYKDVNPQNYIKY